MESLPLTIDSFFSSLIPGVWQLLFIYIILILLVREQPWPWLRRKIGMQANWLKELAKEEFVKESGLLKLLPVLTLIATLALAIGVQRVSLAIGSAVPGSLGFTQPTTMIHAVPPEKLAWIWQNYPRMEEFNTVWSLIELRALEAERELADGQQMRWQRHDKKFLSSSEELKYLKFTMLFTLLCWFVLREEEAAHQNSVKRVVIICIICLALSVQCLLTMAYHKRKSDSSKAEYVELLLRSDQALNESLDDETRIELYRQRLEASKQKYTSLLRGFYLDL